MLDLFHMSLSLCCCRLDNSDYYQNYQCNRRIYRFHSIVPYYVSRIISHSQSWTATALSCQLADPVRFPDTASPSRRVSSTGVAFFLPNANTLLRLRLGLVYSACSSVHVRISNVSGCCTYLVDRWQGFHSDWRCHPQKNNSHRCRRRWYPKGWSTEQSREIYRSGPRTVVERYVITWTNRALTRSDIRMRMLVSVAWLREAWIDGGGCRRELKRDAWMYNRL